MMFRYQDGSNISVHWDPYEASYADHVTFAIDINLRNSLTCSTIGSCDCNNNQLISWYNSLTVLIFAGPCIIFLSFLISRAFPRINRLILVSWQQ